ncbi:hypothetical protein [Paenibacillus sp. MER TA 81-3]|uniref:hypothetical protein n=1 Tax=Paenibacillus sp. MER TA 81-3 TaxID=2939573 RepID=UPI00203A6B0D|nr:hypothetical protein [Paenibacillus sp. MER TA 81-3]
MGIGVALIYTLEAVPVGKYTVKCAESAIKSDADWNLYSGSGWYEQYAAETCQKTV